MGVMRRLSFSGPSGMLLWFLLSWHVVHATDIESGPPSRSIRFIAGSGISHSPGQGLTTFPVRAGFLIHNITLIKQRPLHVGILIEYDGTQQSSHYNPPIVPGVFGPAVIRGTSLYGVSIETNLSYSLLTLRRTGLQSRPGPYVGIATGVYRRTLGQSAYFLGSSTISTISTQRLAEYLQESRWSYMMGTIAGVAIPVPAKKSPLHMDAIVIESSYRHIFGNADLIPGIRRTNQFGLFISGMWRLR